MRTLHWWPGAVMAAAVLTGCGTGASLTAGTPPPSASASATTNAVAAPSGELPKKPGQQVVPDHCGVQPVTYDGRLWEVKAAPFDMGNAPDTVSGFGEFHLDSDVLRFVDREGTELTFTPDDGVPVACM